MKKILVACEESQRTTMELRNYGYEAYSCDIQDCSGRNAQVEALQGRIKTTFMKGDKANDRMDSSVRKSEHVTGSLFKRI